MTDGFVNPWGGFYQGQQALSNAADFRQRQQQMDRQNALYERNDAREGQASEMKLLGIQAETIERALDSVNDEQSHQAYRSFLGHIAQTPMGQGKFFQTIVQRTPERFDPQAMAQGKAMLNSLRQQVAGEGFTLGEGQKRFDASGTLIASGPEKRGKRVESQIDLGDKVRIYYSDGTTAEEPKGARPSVFGEGDPADEMTDEEITYHANMYNLKGVMPALGMGKSPLRMKILKKSAELGGAKGAATVLEGQATMAGLKGSIAQQEKQLGSMGSFVNNLSQQVDKVKELSKELSAFDTRLLNVPLRMVRGRLAGSAEQAKYDMYLAEIESEIGKLATGSTGSVAELSVGAQERWAKIHDKNLSLGDMLKLLEETKNAGNMRLKSVKDQLEDTRKRMREAGQDNPQAIPKTDASSYLQKFED